MFEIEQDPPSRSTSPFKEEADEEERQRPGRHEVREARGEAMERARAGTSYASRQRRLSWGTRAAAAMEVAAGSGRTSATETPMSMGDIPADGLGVTTPMSPNTAPSRYTRDQDRFLTSAYGSRYTQSSLADSASRITDTPMYKVSVASRDVFGPRRAVETVDEHGGW
jgi:hypothetical protein